MRAPGGLVVMSTAGNLTVCWTSPHDDPPDGYHVTSQPLIYATPTSLWINQTNPGAHWVNESVCVNLGTFTPGQTYEVGVVSLRGKDRSKKTSIIHTTGERDKDTALGSLKVCLKTIVRSPYEYLNNLLFIVASKRLIQMCFWCK